MVDLFHQHFDIKPEAAFSYGPGSGIAPIAGLVGYAKAQTKSEKRSGERLIGFVPPTSGMFVCVSLIFYWPAPVEEAHHYRTAGFESTCV